MATNDELFLQMALHAYGLRDEIGIDKGGWHTPAELTAVLKQAGLVESAVSALTPRMNDIGAMYRAHELIHCFDVGLGSRELMQFVSTDTDTQRKLGLDERAFSEVQFEAAFLSGLYHDMILAFSGDRIALATPSATIEKLVTPEAGVSIRGKAQYLKDAVGDDLRGAILLNGVPGAAAQLAHNELLHGSDLPLRSPPRGTKLLGSFSPYKILDAIWYHDGNSPIRGHAEAYSIIGDRQLLFQDGKICPKELIAGVDTILRYTEPDPKWEERQRHSDVALLERMVTKKAGISSPLLPAPERTISSLKTSHDADERIAHSVVRHLSEG